MKALEKRRRIAARLAKVQDETRVQIQGGSGRWWKLRLYKRWEAGGS